MNEPVRDPVDPLELEAELTADTLLRVFRGIQIYGITAAAAPSVMQEIGRIREIGFRAKGGGTGQRVDIDSFDTGNDPFVQLVAWDPQHREIIGMYRLTHLANRVGADGLVNSPTARLFGFSPAFIRDYLPYTVELGRSVVNRSARKALMGLYCVWAGLGAVLRERSDVLYFFGKVTMYPSYDSRARNAIYRYLQEFCPDPDNLVRPHSKFAVGIDEDAVTAAIDGGEPNPFEKLGAVVRGFGEAIPPLLISYLELSVTMRSFGTAHNPHFGNVFETGILVTIADINEKQRGRFIDSYVPGAEPSSNAVAASL